MIDYKLRDGFSIGAPVHEVASRIEWLKKQHATPDNPEGWVTSEEVIEDAKSEDSPLHGCFTWDVGEAALNHWRDRARYLMRSYEIHISEPNHKPIVISPGSVHVMSSEDGPRSRFVSPAVAMSKTDEREQVLRDTLGQLKGIENRLRLLRGLSPDVLKAIDLLLKAIDKSLKSKKAAAKKEAEVRA